MTNPPKTRGPANVPSNAKAFSLILMSLLSISPTVAVAQTAGGQVGLNRSTLGSGGSNTGLTVGGYVAFALNHYFSIQPALLYSERGGTSALSVTFVDMGRVLVESRLQVKLKYVDLPLLTTLHVPLANRLRVHFATGPSVSFLVRCTGSVHTRSVDLFTGEQRDTDEGPLLECPEFKNTDVTLVLGGGVDLAVAGTTLTADVRYNLGLLNIAVRGAEIRNRVLAVTLGVALRP